MTATADTTTATVLPPGPQRLFPVAPAPDRGLLVVADDGRIVLSTRHLAAAVYAAAATAASGTRSWVQAPDHWHLCITRRDTGWTVVDSDGPAPIDAIQRVLNTVPGHLPESNRT